MDPVPAIEGLIGRAGGKLYAAIYMPAYPSLAALFLSFLSWVRPPLAGPLWFHLSARWPLSNESGSMAAPFVTGWLFVK